MDVGAFMDTTRLRFLMVNTPVNAEWIVLDHFSRFAEKFNSEVNRCFRIDTSFSPLYMVPGKIILACNRFRSEAQSIEDFRVIVRGSRPRFNITRTDSKTISLVFSMDLEYFGHDWDTFVRTTDHHIHRPLPETWVRKYLEFDHTYKRMEENGSFYYIRYVRLVQGEMERRRKRRALEEEGGKVKFESFGE